LSRAESDALAFQVVNVCKTSVDLDNDHTKFPADWLVHHRWGNGKPKGKKARTADDESIDFDTIAGRTTAIVRQRQKMSGWATLEEEKAEKKAKPAAKATRVKGQSKKDVSLEEPTGDKKKKTTKKTNPTKRGVKRRRSESDAAAEASEEAPPVESERKRRRKVNK